MRRARRRPTKRGAALAEVAKGPSSDAHLRGAVAPLNLTAAARVQQICKAKGTPAAPAPTEAESQLSWGGYDVVYANDVDYVVQGCRSVLFSDGILWNGTVRHYLRDRLTQPPGAGGDDRLNRAVVSKGLSAIKIYALLAGNDYFSIKGVAQGTALDAISRAAALTLPGVVAGLLSTKAGMACGMAADTIRRGAERAAVMFFSQPVWDGTKLIHKQDPGTLGLELTTSAEVDDMSGMSALRSATWSVPAFCTGGLSIETMEPHAGGASTTVGAGSVSVSAASPHGPDLEGPPDRIDSMQHDELYQWLLDRGRRPAKSTTNAGLRKMIIGMCRVGLTLLVKADSVPELEAARSKNDHACWVRYRAKGWSSVAESDRQAQQPLLSSDLVTAYAEDLNFNTVRNRLGGATRYVAGERVRWSKPPAEAAGGKPGFTANGKIPVMTFEYWCVVGKSYAGKYESDLDKRTSRTEKGHDGRPVYLKLLCLGHKGAGSETLAILECFCLLPESACTASGELKKVASDYRHCRDAGKCLHCRAALENIVSGATDGSCSWVRRSRNQAHEKAQPARDLPIPHGPGTRDDDGNHPAQSRCTVAPFQARKIAAMKRATQSRACRPALDRYIQIKKAALDERSKLERDGRGRARGYPLKIEAVLLPMDGARLTDEQLARAADNRAAAVRARVSRQSQAPEPFGGFVLRHLAYDCGLSGSAVSELERHGVAVHTPDMRVDSQLAHSEVSMDRNRAVATERVNIERNNREFRLNDGFNSQCRLDTIDIADAEAQVARGIANLNRVLHSWNDGTGVTISRAGDGDREAPTMLF